MASAAKPEMLADTLQDEMSIGNGPTGPFYFCYRVEIDREMAKQLQHAILKDNREVCFLLGGMNVADVFRVTAALRLPNRARSRFFFIIDEADYNLALNHLKRHPRPAEQRVDNVFGFFHSHLRDNEPSEDDIHSMTKNRGIWVIAHLTNSSDIMFDSYHCSENRPERLPTRII